VFQNIFFFCSKWGPQVGRSSLCLDSIEYKLQVKLQQLKMNVWASAVQSRGSHKIAQNTFYNRHQPLSLESLWLKWNRGSEFGQHCPVLQQPAKIPGQESDFLHCVGMSDLWCLSTLLYVLVLCDSCL